LRLLQLQNHLTPKATAQTHVMGHSIAWVSEGGLAPWILKFDISQFTFYWKNVFLFVTS